MPLKRRRSRAFLHAFTEALRLVALDYATFVARGALNAAEEDSKSFQQRHAAARSGLAHVTQLLDLLGEDAGIEPLRSGFTLLGEAQAALGLTGHGHAPPQDREDEDEDGDEDDDAD